MKIYAVLIAFAFAHVPSVAPAQSVSACGTAAIAKAKSSDRAKLAKNADCFGKVKGLASAAEAVRRERITSLAPAPTPIPIPTPVPAVTGGRLYVGDSLSYFWGGSHTGIQAKAHPADGIRSEAVSGSGVDQVAGTRLAAALASKPREVVIWFGANDLNTWNRDEAGWWAAERVLGAKFTAIGATVRYGTVLPQCGATEHNRRALIVNTWIRAQVPFVDYAAQPGLADPCDKNVYSDGLHPLDGTAGKVDGQRLLAKADEAAFYPAAAFYPPLPEPPVIPALATTIAPMASNFDRLPLLVRGYALKPPTAAPDNLGAFRFICTPGQINRDDPILYPGVVGGSPHDHQWYGNTLANAASTYASLRTTGESTCSNKLNRSAYWVPALFNAHGRIIRPDYEAIYYKRVPAGDPDCQKMAAKGCVGIPTGLRVVSGYDTRRMGHKQPENATYFHRCVTPGKPSDHRATLAEAVRDCGGAGQIITAIGFGNCWTGELDSSDHRSHLTHASYGDWGYPKCPAKYPYVIPELTQQLAYTIEASDGDIYFASDRMNGMTMAGGTTFHADYMEAWDPPARETWTANCLDKLLTCVDGELGDGTMLKRGANVVVANPRLVDAPARPAAMIMTH